MVFPESRSNWTSFKISGIPESAISFAPNNNGVDIIRPTDHLGYIYEDLCFTTLAERYPENFVVGPHIIDFIAGKYPIFKKKIVPDLLFLEAGIFDEELPGVYGVNNAVKLTGFAEFRSGKSYGFQRKIEGFMRLLKDIRSNPDQLLMALQETLGSYLEIPDRLLVAPDEQFKIQLIKPVEKESAIIPPHGVIIDFLTIPTTS